jgi:hypothetical protein
LAEEESEVAEMKSGLSEDKSEQAEMKREE